MTGIILAGGKSSRFNGVNKALLKIGNETIIENIIKKFKFIFNEILIVTNNPSAFNHLTNHNLTKLVKDIIPDKTSLGGLYSGLVYSSNQHNFVVACDMPFLNLDLIKYMLENVTDQYDIIIPRLNNRSLPNNGYETLHAIYSKNCITPIEKQLKQNNFKIIDFFSEVKVKEISENTIRQFDPELLSFFNINTEDDYQQALEIY